jgi:hypothetical protein
MNLSRRAGFGGRRESVSRASVHESPASLVELVPVTTARLPARYVVAVGPVSFEFGDDIREETLRRVLGVLRSC